MNSEEPFWQTATNEQLKHTMFKVTYKSGGIFIGYLTVENSELVPVLGDVGNVTGLYVTLDERNRVCDFVQSIEVVDSTIPDGYMRNEKVTGYYLTSYDGSPAIVVLKNGNRGKIAGFQGYALLVQFNGDIFDGNSNRFVGEDNLTLVDNSQIDYYLLKTKKLPDKSGLWKDKDGDIWVYSARANTMRRIRQSGAWNPATCEGILNEHQCKAYAPFTPWTPED